MRTLTSLVASAVLVLGAGVAVADPVGVPLFPAPNLTYKTSNVTHVGTIPLDGVGVSMEVRKVGQQVRAFVSGAGGLSIYDATDPTKPSLLGHLPIYNWENEDIAVSQDGKIAILTEFTAQAYLHVIDVSDPNAIKPAGTIPGEGPHTVVCADRACNYLYGSEGQTFDIRNRNRPAILPRDKWWGEQLGGANGHNLHQDESGLWIADTSPLLAFRQVKGNPLDVQLVTTGRISLDTNYQHNNIRVGAAKYKPRKPGESLGGPLRPGELLLGNGESSIASQCRADAGAFATWSMAGFDQGIGMTQIDAIRPVAGNYADGNPALSGLDCSGHWFTQKPAKDGSVLVTAAWYEHGTRFLKVNPKTGKIRQVGFFQPVRGSTSEAFWMPGSDVVWTLDYHSGIDILRFDQSKPDAKAGELAMSWLPKTGRAQAWSELMRIVCREKGDITAPQRTELARLTHTGHHAGR